MNHHLLPITPIQDSDAQAILGWNNPLNEFYAHVYSVRADGLLGDLLYSTVGENFFPDDVEKLEQWLEQKAVSIPKNVLNAVQADQTHKRSSFSARYGLDGDLLLTPEMKGQMMLC
jgi:hypothetical protein